VLSTFEEIKRIAGSMTINSKYIFVASMDVDPDKEALFNQVYDPEHIPNLFHSSTKRAASDL
jgi:hypothetical protein